MADKSTQQFECPAPSRCTVCYTSCHPTLLSAHHIPIRNSFKRYRIFTLFFCPSCEKCFQVTYVYNGEIGTSIENVTPVSFIPNTFDEYIQKVSPSYCKIYNQALEAEKHKLTELTGLGFRRALEFLIKDYLIYKNPDDREKIMRQSLSEAIKTIGDDRLLVLSQKSAWLGNDHAHYISKHPDKTTEDLKKFINAAQNLISWLGAVEEAESIQ